MTCYECGRQPGEAHCHFEDGCPRGEREGTQHWACIPAPKPPRQKAVCVGGRTEHTMEPDWQGRYFTHMRCRWCRKREAV